MTETPKTRPSTTTRDEEARDAQVHAGADESEGPESASTPPLDDDVSEHYEEMIERGADQRGEGRTP